MGGGVNAIRTGAAEGHAGWEKPMSSTTKQLGRRGAARYVKLAVGAILLIELLATTGARARAGVRLLMVEQAGCVYCLRWDREVGVAYPKSPQGRFAPLVRRPIGHEDLRRLVPPAVYTPTFVVLDGAREIGRIVGYPGADFFWEELDVILARAGFEALPSVGPDADDKRADGTSTNMTIAERPGGP
jgi:hypothetical protein